MADELLALLRERLRDDYDPLLADTSGTIRFVADGRHPAGGWTVSLDRGRAAVLADNAGAPTTTVRASVPVLRDVISGSRSGLDAFLAGDLTVRGNLALSLKLDGLFPARVDDGTRTVTRHADAAGIDTFYLEAGPPDAPAVVLVHGLGATNASMLPLIPPLARDHRVLAPDLPGHGGTQAVRTAHELPYFGRWLTAFLRATCDRPAVLIGNSLGGRTALETALHSPQAVRGLVLLCPAVAFRRMRQFVPLVRLIRDDLAALPAVIPRGLAMRGLRALFADPTRLPQAWYDAAIDEFLRVIGRRANRQATFSALRHVYLDEPFGGSGFWTRLPSLQPPALFVWGARDRLVPAAFARYVTEALPAARSVVLDDCGHVPQFEHPGRTADLVTDFLSRL